MKKDEDCRCDTGSYCRVHWRYFTRPKHLPKIILRGYNARANQRCGGGRRLSGKAPVGTNY